VPFFKLVLLQSLDSYWRNSVASKFVKIEIFACLILNWIKVGDVVMLRSHCLGHRDGSDSSPLQNIVFLNSNPVCPCHTSKVEENVQSTLYHWPTSLHSHALSLLHASQPASQPASQLATACSQHASLPAQETQSALPRSPHLPGGSFHQQASHKPAKAGGLCAVCQPDCPAGRWALSWSNSDGYHDMIEVFRHSVF
jgi:hypothetical protein